MTPIKLFRPHALKGRIGRIEPNSVRIIREGILIRDLTMPERDWSVYDSLAKDRYVSLRKKPQPTQAADDPSNVVPITTALLRRQAE